MFPSTLNWASSSTRPNRVKPFDDPQRQTIALALSQPRLARGSLPAKPSLPRPGRPNVGQACFVRFVSILFPKCQCASHDCLAENLVGPKSAPFAVQIDATPLQFDTAPPSSPQRPTSSSGCASAPSPFLQHQRAVLYSGERAPPLPERDPHESARSSLAATTSFFISMIPSSIVT